MQCVAKIRYELQALATLQRSMISKRTNGGVGYSLWVGTMLFGRRSLLEAIVLCRNVNDILLTVLSQPDVSFLQQIMYLLSATVR